MPQLERIQTPYLTPEDELDRSLRPRRLDDFVGQATLREQLAVAIEAACARGEALDPAAASAIKVFGTEFYLEAFRLLMEILGPVAPVKASSPEAVLRGRLEARTRSMHILTFGGGTNEMQRDLIAIFGLGMPGSPR